MVRTVAGYLFHDREEVATTVLVGGMLTFFSFLLVPHVVLFGYFVQVLRRTTRGVEAPPRFDDWSELLADGSKAYFIWLLWTAFPLAISYLVFQGDLEQGRGTLFLLGWIVPGNVISLFEGAFVGDFAFVEPYILFVLVLYFFPASLFCYLEHGTFKAAFSTRYLRPKVTSDRYVLAWIGFAIFWLLAELPLRLWSFGVFLVPVSFYLKVTGWVFISRAFPAASSDSGTGPTTYQQTLLGVQPTETQPPPLVRIPDRFSLVNLTGVPLKTYLAGGFLMSLSIYVLPGILAIGYLVRTIRSATDRTAAPTFGHLWRLFFDGLRAYAVWAVCVLVPLSLVAVTILQRWDLGSARANLANWSLVSGIGLPGGYPAVLLFLLGSFGFVTLLGVLIDVVPSLTFRGVHTILSIPPGVAVGTFLVGLYVVPGVLTRVATHRSVRRGFAWREVLRTLRSRSYPLKWVTVIVLTVPGWIALSWAYMLLLPALLETLPATPLVQLASIADLRVLFPVPASISSVREVVVWVFLLSSGVLYFALLVASSRIVGRM